MQQQHPVVATDVPPRRDPQSFTRGDVLAWKVVAYVGGALMAAGTAAVIVLFVQFALS